MAKIFRPDAARPDIEHLLPDLPDEGSDEHQTWTMHDYTPGARQLLARAQTLADHARHREVVQLHVARTLLDLPAIQKVIRRNGADPIECMKQVDEALSKTGHSEESGYLSGALVAALRRAERKTPAGGKVSIAKIISTLDDGSDPRLERLLALCVSTPTP